MRIAFIVTRSDAVGGAQIHVRDLAVALRTAGHDATVLVGGNGPWLQQLEDRGIPFVRLRHMMRAVSPLSDLLALIELRRRLRELRPDLVSTHTAKAGWLGRIAAASMGLPVMFTAHGWSFTEGVSKLQARIWRFAERLVGPLSSRIVTVSEFDRRLALEARIAGATRIHAIHNGMPDIGQELRADPVVEPVHLVMVARFEAQKDHRSLLTALSKLRQLRWKLTLVGDGPLINDMRNLARDLDINDRVFFVGARNDVAQILAQAQLFVLSTHWEGLPRSIIEAMRAGLPIIATRVAGVPEQVVDGDNGYLCPPGDIDQLATQLSKLIGSPSLRVEMGKRSREHYETSFRFERMFEMTLDTYRMIAGAPSQIRSSRQSALSAKGSSSEVVR